MTHYCMYNLPRVLDILTGTNYSLASKNELNRAQKPFFHKKVKSGRQVLKSPQNSFFLNTLTKINLKKYWIIWAK